MINQKKWPLNNTKAFSIIEIIIVCVMLGILAAVAVPKVIGPTEFIRSKEGRDTLVAVLGSQKRFSIDNAGAYTNNFALLDVSPYPASTIFNAPVALNPGGAGNVASVARNNGTYTLLISDAGVITCAPVGPACTAIFCNKGGGNNQCN